MLDDCKKIPSSFRDPSGFLFSRGSVLFRQINQCYREHYDALIASKLYQRLVKEELLIPHEEVEVDFENSHGGYKTIQPEAIPFISYPYEWSFSQLKDAALLTLRIQKIALEHGMVLKDASAYNIQFKKCRPIFIDTLSFEKYGEGKPWVAYRQFCQHFLAPLALMSRKDIRLGRLLGEYIDGIPLDLSSTLLGFRTLFNFSLLSHVHLHARSQKKFADKRINPHKYRVSKTSLLHLMEHLESAIHHLNLKNFDSHWKNYYQETNYSPKALEQKKKIVESFLEATGAKRVCDLGANVGDFSRITSRKKMGTISIDNDPLCVEANYLQCQKDGETNILPLCIDLTNPSADIGWENEERVSLIKRGPVDAVLALALIHHLVIANNLPFEKIATFFSHFCQWLIIEFISKEDSQVQRLLTSRQDIFLDYTRQYFETVFSRYFKIQKAVAIEGTHRILYLMHP